MSKAQDRCFADKGWLHRQGKEQQLTHARTTVYHLLGMYRIKNHPADKIRHYSVFNVG